jgi:hypothetical protein
MINFESTSDGGGISLQIPLVNALLVPELQSSLQLLRNSRFLLAFHLLQEQGELLAELRQALEPVASMVLIPVAYEDQVEEFLDVEERLLVTLIGAEKRVGGDLGRGFGSDFADCGGLKRLDSSHGGGCGEGGVGKKRRRERLLYIAVFSLRVIEGRGVQAEAAKVKLSAQ